MVSLYDMARQTTNRPGFLDFQRESEEFDARRKQRQMQEQLRPLEMQKAQLALAQAEKNLATGASSNDPAAVREWNFYSKLSPQEQQKYLSMKRTDQVLNLGGQMAVRSPTGGIQESYNVTPKTSEMPEFKAAQAGASEAAKLGQQLQYEPAITSAVESQKSGAARQSELRELEATLPQLLDTVRQLGELGQRATYTMGGQARDAAVRELGMGATEGAIARKEYESLVNNQILPLLRQTFGAQFTEREGEQLRKTLGDVNASPAEKDAVLRSFIQQKQAQIETLRRQTGQAQQPAQGRQRITLDEFLAE